MVAPAFPEGELLRTGVERYLGPNEHVVYATRRHSVVLDSVAAVWLGALVVGLAAGLASQAHPGSHLDQMGAAVLLAVSLFFGWKSWRWWVARYVLTNQRVLFIEGILSRRVNGLPLESVLDTTYHRTLAGRLFGYGDLELNLSGQPGLRKLTSLPQPDLIYHLILSLTSVRDVMYSTWPGIGNDIEGTTSLPQLST